MHSTLRKACPAGNTSLRLASLWHRLRLTTWRRVPGALRMTRWAGGIACTMLAGFAQATPDCPLPAKHCIGLIVHTVHEGPQPVVPPEWLPPRIAHANRLFAAVDVQFAVAGRRQAPAAFADLRTREQRDALGRGRTSPGSVHLFIVRRLADVDVVGQVIRGVHWRLRPETDGAPPTRIPSPLPADTPRWIILSSIAPPLVLAHELGHYFGLPHSRDGRSLMNKQKGGGRPPWPSRSFLPGEHRRMRVHRDAMLGSQWLVALGQRVLDSQDNPVQRQSPEGK